MTIVTGVPRSGTSMMMRMLDSGGIRAFADGSRLPDVHNPGGYFEYGPVKRLAKDSSWLDVARGRSLKVIYRLVRHLPDRLSYRVIFMERDLGEVLESQEKMLRRLDRTPAPSDQMRRSFTIHLQKLFQWLPQQFSMQVLKISYNLLLENPQSEIAKVTRFLDDTTDSAQMLAAIDTTLYRNRHPAT